MRLNVIQGTDEFILEVTTTDTVDSCTSKCAELHNLRLRVDRLAHGVRELCKYGPMKHPEKHGMSEEQINALGDGTKEVAGQDPLGMREGVAPHEKVIPVLLKCADEAEAAVSNEHAKRRNPLDLDKIKELLMNIKGAVMMAYPMGLPEWDTVKLNLDDNENLDGQEESKYVLEPADCIMWFAGKKMDRGQLMNKYVGKNEKCTVKVKLTNKNGGAPQREPAVDAETQKKMMSYWHKKQEEQKNLESNNDDNFLHSSWANPKAMKSQINGINNIKIR